MKNHFCPVHFVHILHVQLVVFSFSSVHHELKHHFDIKRSLFSTKEVNAVRVSDLLHNFGEFWLNCSFVIVHLQYIKSLAYKDPD